MTNIPKILGNRLLVRRVEKQERIDGGINCPNAREIFIPATVQDRDQWFECDVVALGTGSDRDKEAQALMADVVVGNRLICLKSGGVPVPLDGETLRVISILDVLAVKE